jgi:hypothetical protein
VFGNANMAHPLRGTQPKRNSRKWTDEFLLNLGPSNHFARSALPRERFRSMARPGCAGDDQLFLPSIVDRTCRLESALKMKKPSGDLRRTAFLFQCQPISRFPETNCGSGTKSQLANKLSIASSWQASESHEAAIER